MAKWNCCSLIFWAIIVIIFIIPYFLLFVPLKLLVSCCKVRRPRPKNSKPDVLPISISTSNSSWEGWFDWCSWLYHRCFCSLKFVLSVQKAIKRYEEHPPKEFDEFVNELQQNWKINTLLTTLNTKTPQFFFKILPSGSIRERFGKVLPSRSILASDYDLMLVPDVVQVRDARTSTNYNALQLDNSNRVFPATFEAVDDPNSNPGRPIGYLWLKLLEDLQHWKKLCYQRLTMNGVELYLSQLAVYDLVKSTILNSPSVKDMFSEEDKDVEISVERSGPAMTVKIVKPKSTGFGILSDSPEAELFHVDFTLAIHCPKFPSRAEGFFKKRRDQVSSHRHSSRRNLIYWPSQEVVQRIETIGCHVVPKPSTKELVFYTPEQKELSYLAQGAALEWRYSFSQAEMLLSDVMPKQARTAFLAFKGVIKMRINNQPDMWGKFHEIASFVLKNILLKEVENKPPAYWIDGVEEEFLNRLLDVLIVCIGERMCKMYWIEQINLLEELEDSDVQFIIVKLQRIKTNLSRYLTDDWIECQRLLQLNCCQCYDTPPTIKDLVLFEADVYKRACCNIPCKSGSNTCCCGPLRYDPNKFDVY